MVFLTQTILRNSFRVPVKIHQTNKIALNYTISHGIHNWSAKIEITGWHVFTTTKATNLNKPCFHPVIVCHHCDTFWSIPPLMSVSCFFQQATFSCEHDFKNAKPNVTAVYHARAWKGVCFGIHLKYLSSKNNPLQRFNRPK